MSGKTNASATSLGGLAGVGRILGVRLRFAAVILVTALVIGKWETLRTYGSRWFAGVSAASSSVSPDTEFFCPMCPGVLSSWPDRCPVCFMPLVRRKKGEAELLPEGVTARMHLSPVRIQLAGIRTEVVESRELVHSVSEIGPVIQDHSTSTRGDRDSPDSLAVRIRLAPSDWRFVREGQMAEIKLVDFSEAGAWSGIVAQCHVGPRADLALIYVVADESAPKLGELVRVTIQQPIESLDAYAGRYSSGDLPSVPLDAVVDTGEAQYVFVESAPGMFDAVPVELGMRVGGYYPVLAGLSAGQRVASSGAFLIDAETRLNSSVRSTYFGANPEVAKTDEAANVRVKRTVKTKRKQPTVREMLADFEMSVADRAAAERQQVCPVTNAPLGSMGPPIRVTVDGKPIFICCEGCRSEVENRNRPAQP